jgi:hypothetical protein
MCCKVILFCNVEVSVCCHVVFWMFKGVKNAAVHMNMAAHSTEFRLFVTNLFLRGHGLLYQSLIWQLTRLEQHLLAHQVSNFSTILIQQTCLKTFHKIQADPRICGFCIPGFSYSWFTAAPQKFGKLKKYMVHKFRNMRQVRMGCNMVKSSIPNAPST